MASGLAAPLQIDVSSQGVLVGQSFGGMVSVVDRHGTVSNLVEGDPLDGVAWRPGGNVLFTHTDGESLDEQGVAEAELRIRRRDGSIHTIADLRAFEEANNPDSINSYGFQGLDPECAASLPPDAGLLPYTGILDSHPYALAVHGRSTYVRGGRGERDPRCRPRRQHPRGHGAPAATARRHSRDR